VPLTNGSHVNGQQCLGENIADNGGIHLAWNAYQVSGAMWLARCCCSDACVCTCVCRRVFVSPVFVTLQTLVNGTANLPLFPESGLTNDQLVFLWYAQNWCTVYTPEAAEQRLEFDVHSPDMFRVIGPLSNSPAFATAYQCKPTDPMGRSLTPSACALW
jgi:predicted metalloendopeptidase